MNNQLFPAVSTDVSLVSITDGEPRTTTLAIADGTENEHASIIALVRNYLSDLGEFGNVDFKSTLNPGQKRATEYASLNEGQSTFLLTLMRNSEIVVAFKKRLVKAFLCLKSHPVAPAIDLNDPITLTTLLLSNLEKLEEQKLQIVHLDKVISDIQPKADIAEQLILSDGSVNLTTAAKLLGVPPHKFPKELQQRQWIYKRPGSTHWLAYQPKIALGYVEHKEYLKVLENGDTRAYPQVMITQKGLARLAVIFKSSQMLLEVA